MKVVRDLFSGFLAGHLHRVDRWRWEQMRTQFKCPFRTKEA